MENRDFEPLFRDEARSLGEAGFPARFAALGVDAPEAEEAVTDLGSDTVESLAGMLPLAADAAEAEEARRGSLSNVMRGCFCLSLDGPAGSGGAAPAEISESLRSMLAILSCSP